MAALTWRDIAAPDFSTALQAFKASTDTLNQGLAIAKSGLGEFDKTRNEEASKSLMANLMTRYTDQSGLAGAAADGSLLKGYDVSMLSPEALAMIGSRQTDLQNLAKGNAQIEGLGLQNDGQREANSFDLFTHGNARDDRTHFVADRNASDAFRPVYGAFTQKMNTGDEAGANAILDTAEGQAALAALPIEIQDQVRKGGASGLKSYLDTQVTRQDLLDRPIQREGLRLGNQGKQLDIATGQFNLTNSREDRASQKLGEQAVLSASLAPDVNTARRMLLATTGGDGRAFAYGLQQLESRFPGIVGSTPSSMIPGGATGGGGGGPVGSGGDGAPIDYNSFRQGLESGSRPGAKSATSNAVGIDQFTPRTFLSTVKDAKPKWADGLTDQQILAQRTNAQRSGEMEQVLRSKNARILANNGIEQNNASLYAMHHFSPPEAVRFLRAGGDTPTSKIFSAEVIKANPYLADKTRDQVLQNWAQRSGDRSILPASNPANRLGANPSAAAQITAQFRAAQRETSSIAPDWASAAGDKRSFAQVVTDLRGPNGDLRGASETYVNNALADIQLRTNSNPAQAAAILSKSVTSSDPSSWGAYGRHAFNATLGHLGFRPYDPELPGGRRVNTSLADQFVAEIRSPGLVDSAVEGQRLQAVPQIIAQAQGQFQQADQAYRQAYTAYRSGDDRQAMVLPRLQAARNEAYLALQAINKQASGDANNKYRQPGSYSIGGVPGLADVRGNR